VTPGEPFELSVELDCVSWRFAAGHRIRLSIANADWPNVWPTPEPATSQIHRGAGRPSQLMIPTVSGEPTGRAPDFRPAPTAPISHAESITRPVWRVERDALSGEARTRYYFDYSVRVSPNTVIRRSYEFEGHVDPKTPSQASARGRHHSTIERPSGTISATSNVSVRGSSTRFHVTIELNVEVDGARRHQRRWTESIPRRLV